MTILLVFAFLFHISSGAKDVPFELNYIVTYSPDHTQLLNQHKEIELSIDEHSGSFLLYLIRRYIPHAKLRYIYNIYYTYKFIIDFAGTGFRSLKRYGSGLFGMRLKLPKHDTRGILTTFYVRTQFSCLFFFFFKNQNFNMSSDLLLFLL